MTKLNARAGFHGERPAGVALRSRWLVPLGFLLPISGGIAQQRGLTGVVVDSTGAPVPYANITILQSGRRTVAGIDGRFSVGVDSASGATLHFRRIGYHPQTLALETTPDTGLRIVLAAAAKSLSAVRVAATRVQSLAIRGFYERQADVERGINHGFFITSEELEQRPAAKVTDLLRQFPAIRVGRVKEDARDGRSGLQPQGVDGCRLEIYVDGVRFYNIGLKRNYLPPGAGLFIDEAVTTNTIAAIEIYPRAVTSPPKYQSLNGTCGVMLIWTK